MSGSKPIQTMFLHGTLSLLLLKLLDEEDMYGYELMRVLLERSNNTINIQTGSLFPLLATLERDRAVRSYLGKKDGSNTKSVKLWSITDTGRKMLAERTEDWEHYVSVCQSILAGT